MLAAAGDAALGAAEAWAADAEGAEVGARLAPRLEVVVGLAPGPVAPSVAPEPPQPARRLVITRGSNQREPPSAPRL